MTDKSKDDSPEKALQNELEQAEELGKAIAEQGRGITHIGQRLVDQAKATREVAQFLPAEYDREQFIDDWHHVNRTSSIALEQLFLNVGLMTTTSSSADIAYVNSTSAFTEGNLLPQNPADKRPYIIAAINNFDFVFVQADIKNECLSIIISLQLDISVPGKKKPSELFEIAHRAYQQPLIDSDPVATSLIPMRECIQTIIDELLRRRPTQEKSSRQYDKIFSIGTQLKGAGVDASQVHTWACQWEEINDELSASKRAALTREEWARHLRRATAFLNGLLKGLDPSKVHK